MRQVLFVILLFQFVLMNSQELRPGGVQGAIFWKITEAETLDLARWKSNINEDSTTLPIQGKLSSINSYPAIVFNSQQTQANNSLNLGELKTFSLFTVCKTRNDIDEQVIFSLENDSLTKTVLTNQRMAALDIYRYYNYRSDQDLHPKIYSYTQNHTEGSGMKPTQLNFGRSPHRENLPVSIFQGIVPELIVFNRSVSPGERRKVESYLALKYGISLNQEFPASYLNSRGEIIWDAELSSMYNSSIAGIGRDDVSGLKQQASESSESPGVLQIGITETLVDNSFLIWGDNNGPLRFEEFSGVRKFERQWKVSAFKNSGRTLYFKSDELAFSEIDPLHEGETYWLMIDQTGTGKYPFGHTLYFKAQSSYKYGKSILFTPVVIDNDSSGTDIFTLLIAPPFFTRSSVLDPNCFDVGSGSIQTEIAGGVGPYKMLLLGETDPEFKEIVIEPDASHIFTNLRQGEYSLHITDADNNTFFEKIWVSNQHAWESALHSRYGLSERETLHLDASVGMPRGNYFYSWVLPDGDVYNSEEILIDQPGEYVLDITDENNCNSLQEVEVLQLNKTRFRNTELFPNPAKNWFVLRIELESKSDVSIIISDMKGGIVIQDKLQNEKYYRYVNFVQQSGIYTITLLSGNEKETLKLIVN